jgi:hypothetical protein
VEHDQLTEQTVKPEVYEPPMIVEIGRFQQLTTGGSYEIQDVAWYQPWS